MQIDPKNCEVSRVPRNYFSNFNECEGWLQAIARALGIALGEKAQKMAELAKQVGSGDAKESNKAIALLAAESQLYGILSNSVTTVIKTVGEANAALARKTS